MPLPFDESHFGGTTTEEPKSRLPFDASHFESGGGGPFTAEHFGATEESTSREVPNYEVDPSAKLVGRPSETPYQAYSVTAGEKATPTLDQARSAGQLLADLPIPEGLPKVNTVLNLPQIAARRDPTFAYRTPEEQMTAVDKLRGGGADQQLLNQIAIQGAQERNPIENTAVVVRGGILNTANALAKGYAGATGTPRNFSNAIDATAAASAGELPAPVATGANLVGGFLDPAFIATQGALGVPGAAVSEGLAPAIGTRAAGYAGAAVSGAIGNAGMGALQGAVEPKPGLTPLQSAAQGGVEAIPSGAAYGAAFHGIGESGKKLFGGLSSRNGAKVPEAQGLESLKVPDKSSPEPVKQEVLPTQEIQNARPEVPPDRSQARQEEGPAAGAGNPAQEVGKAQDVVPGGAAEVKRSGAVVDPFAGERFRLVNRESGSGDQTPPRPNNTRYSELSKIQRGDIINKTQKLKGLAKSLGIDTTQKTGGSLIDEIMAKEGNAPQESTPVENRGGESKLLTRETTAPQTPTPEGGIPRVKGRERQGGFLNIQPLSEGIDKVIEKVKDLGSPREIIGKIKDYVSTDTIPRTTRVAPKAAAAGVEHASATAAAPYVVRDLVAKVAPENYRDPAFLNRVQDVINKDNILGGYDEFIKGDHQKLAQAVAHVHDLAGYEADVKAAMADPKIAKAVENYKNLINPEMDKLYSELKGIDPRTLQPTRGRLTGARTNLKAITEELPRGEAIKPAAGQGNVRNVNVKRDPFNRGAKFTGNYDTDMQSVLENSFGRRLNEATKLRYYKALESDGAAKITDPSVKVDLIDGMRARRLPIKIPVTDAKGNTSHVEKALWVRNDIYHETHDVLNLGIETPKNPALHAATTLQMLGVADATSHAKNLMSVLLNSPKGRVVGVELARKLPGVNVADALADMTKTARDVYADSPEMRAKLSKMAQAGLIRPDSEQHGPAGKALYKLDTAVRVILNDRFDALVKQGSAVDSAANRRDFVNQAGQYNRRLMGPIQRWMKEHGLSPFVVAGRNFNRQGRRLVLGDPGFEATSNTEAIKQRAINQFGNAVTLLALPLIANAIISGKPMGRPGTPLGAIDLGKPEDDSGKFDTFDYAQLTGLRRGLRATGLEAMTSGIRENKGFNETAGDMKEQIAETATHPFFGPGVGATSIALTGKAFEPFRSFPQKAEVEPHGGIRQDVQNVKAAVKETNPLLYGLTNAIVSRGENGREDTKKAVLDPLKSAIGVKGAKPYDEGMVHGAVFKDFKEQTARDMRKLSPGERMDYYRTKSEDLEPFERRTLYDYLARQRLLPPRTK